MQIPPLLRLLIPLICLFCYNTTAQEAVKPLADSIKVLHQALQKRPHSKALFDRYYNNWLEESDIGSLEAFLIEKKSPGDLVVLGHFYLKRNNHNAAKKSFQQATDHSDIKILLKAETLGELGKLARKQNDFEQALLEFSEGSVACHRDPFWR